ncbi:Metal-dependent hydrolase, endonuclease/exonuclease/phosphatase family [Chitinophaga ginsengisegetis]|uniref:Metal-dependent hydrolase, endonuclease/exonuclease/phosphatase family n=1 Tax=Chitinophaga ginsengisegetis TaxID=393003 RepID=A0A1T5NIL0_9BACT|nr:endonuclease/exonuclease/phosphatase family protein [Chitinophaga ginsengisegetis]MDR6569731.1 endonuclease/exonuclease/phosphatase family metal-dependent hydrolase [Chitinophaga ginsengisegetis]MDR6649464.1 endonuclease/exonuclease/phosphatase family metal-dependent hydrolase [Chitinophaga ginsengisegetis]MDR6655814.1 endonuclease/exonuclease/phosphatase family metal-dependent hydrolase [Chitinophaga ginsengisegetis]SKD00272.1 Metal-dependent hydrolase, endonuclease/exonuclease/phosphatase 
MKKMLLFTVVCFAGSVLFAQTQKVKVLTYNIHHGENMKQVLDLQGIANVILATNPDLVALQEVDSATGRTSQSDQLKELASITGMYTYFAKSMDFDGGGYGTGILSRFPISNNTTLMLPSAKGNEPRAAGIVTVRLPGDSSLQFVTTHLDAGKKATDRIAQANALADYFKATATPVIIAGDFNAPPASKEINVLKQVFADATSQMGPTFPADSPTIKLDYIMLAPKHRWTITGARIIEETVASDHRPVLCELEMK